MKTLEEALTEYQQLIDSLDNVTLNKYGEDECRGTIGGFGTAICYIYGVTQEYLLHRIKPNPVCQT